MLCTMLITDFSGCKQVLSQWSAVTCKIYKTKFLHCCFKGLGLISLIPSFFFQASYIRHEHCKWMSIILSTVTDWPCYPSLPEGRHYVYKNYSRSCWKCKLKRVIVCFCCLIQKSFTEIVNILFEHTCAYARWAHMHGFLSVSLSVCMSVCLWLDQNSDWTKS